MVGFEYLALKRQKEITVYSKNDMVLAVDYHDEILVIRRFNCHTGEERLLKIPTIRKDITRFVDEAVAEANLVGGRVHWIMESTNGWVRVKALLGDKAQMVVSNVLQMPLPPKAHRKKTDKIDTKRLLREFLCGMLPEAFQPSGQLRQVRRVTAARESLVSRRTALRNWINRYLSHETWISRKGLWSETGMSRLEKFASSIENSDRVVLLSKLSELKNIDALLEDIISEIIRIYKQWPQAQWVDEIYGIAEISAVSILSRIGPVERFSNAEKLISFAGLAPGVHQSAKTCRSSKIGGGGTDKHLRHYIIEATIWARKIPRYQPTYERVKAKRGNKIARIVVGRMLLRSIYKMLKDGVRFDRLPAA